jgi:hypothetical protein
MPDIAKQIQARLKESDRAMSKRMQMTDNTTWRIYKESKAGYLKTLIRLFEISGLSEKQFLQMLRDSIK